MGVKLMSRRRCSVKRVFVGYTCAAVRAEVLVTLQRLHAEGNEAKAEDPAAD